jgi:hypothetical protein
MTPTFIRSGHCRRLSMALITCLIGGCDSSQRIATTRDASSPLALLESVDATSPVARDTMYPASMSMWKYQIARPGREPEPLVRRQRSTDQWDATWMIEEGPDVDHIDRTQFIKVDEDSNLVMTAMIEFKDNAITLFDPPLVLAYASLSPRAPMKQTVAMRVMSLKNPEQRRESGTATQTIEYAGDQRLRTREGEHHAKKIVVSFHADLKLADAHETTTSYVVPGMGIVAEEATGEVKVLGIAGSKHSRTIVLVEMSK